MSAESVELILGKAILDAEFRQLISSNPKETFNSFSLTPAEIQSLLQIDGETLERMAQIFMVSQSAKVRWKAMHPNDQLEPRLSSFSDDQNSLEEKMENN